MPKLTVPAAATPLTEFEVDGKPRWKWVTPLDGSGAVLGHVVWLDGKDRVMWEVWCEGVCLGVHDTGEKGAEAARTLVARVRKSGRDGRFAAQAWRSWKETRK